MNESVGLIVAKIEQLIVATQGKVEAFYPIVRKQIVMEGYMSLFSLVLFLVFLLVAILKCFKKGNWDSSGDPTTPYAVVWAIIGVICVVGSTVSFLTFNPMKILNPDYYAVKTILELGQSLIK